MLNRPHIEFVQAQMLPWRRIGAGLARPDAEIKILTATAQALLDARTDSEGEN